MVTSRGDYVGKVKGALLNLKQSMCIYITWKEVSILKLLSVKITIRPARERREERNRGTGPSQTRSKFRDRSAPNERRSGRQTRSDH